MTDGVLNSKGRKKVALIANRVFHGEDSDFEPENSEPDQIEAELHEMVENEGFETVIPEEAPSGTARKPYLIPSYLLSTDGEYVVKFARYKRGGTSGPQKGRIQNECEIQIWESLNADQQKFFIPIRDYDECYFWLVMDRADVFSDDNPEDAYCIGDLSLTYGPEELNDVVQNMKNSGVKPGDQAGSFGYHNGELKCLDYGTGTKWYQGFSNQERIVKDWGDYDSEHPRDINN
nr:hypothetical protein [Haloferax larsenii]